MRSEHYPTLLPGYLFNLPLLSHSFIHSTKILHTRKPPLHVISIINNYGAEIYFYSIISVKFMIILLLQPPNYKNILILSHDIYSLDSGLKAVNGLYLKSSEPH